MLPDVRNIQSCFLMVVKNGEKKWLHGKNLSWIYLKALVCVSVNSEKWNYMGTVMVKKKALLSKYLI